jgi:hypothetical protein
MGGHRWTVFNIPGSAKGLPEGLAAGDLPDGTRNGPGFALRPGMETGRIDFAIQPQACSFGADICGRNHYLGRQLTLKSDVPLLVVCVAADGSKYLELA